MEEVIKIEGDTIVVKINGEYVRKHIKSEDVYNKERMCSKANSQEIIEFMYPNKEIEVN